jgi:hypothetical protein
MKTSRPFLFLLLGAALLASCRSADREAVSAYGRPPALEEYRQNLGEMEPGLQEGSLFFWDSPGPSDAEYRELVAQYREGGLEALPHEERRSLLMVAQLAFLAHARTVRYSATSEPGSNQEGEVAAGQVVAEEVYRHKDGPSLAAWRVRGNGIWWTVGAPRRRGPDAPHEDIILVEDVPEDAEFVTVREWERRGDQWTCTVTKSGGGWYTVDFVRMSTMAGWPEGELLGQETIDGWSTYRFQGGEVVYWLDAETLWLRQYEFEGFRVKLEAVNEDIRIEPPDVDVDCLEEASE